MKKTNNKRKFSKLSILGIFAVMLSISGCCGYQGFADYKTQMEISRGKEKITGEKVNLQIDKGKFIIEREQKFTYEQQLRVDSKRGAIYTEGSAGQVIANCIFYPFTLISSPLRLLVMNDKKQKEFGREYLYSSGRQTWNMFNPFICTMGKFKLEEEILSSKNKTVTRNEIRRIPVKDGQLLLAFRRQKKAFPVSVTLPEICKTVFDYPLPEKIVAVSVNFNGKNYPLTLKSSMLLSPEDLAAWNSVLNCKTGEQAMKGNGSAFLEKLHKDKKIGDSVYKAEKARLDALEETIKFPMRKISDNRIPLSKDYTSGTSFLWFARKLMLQLKKDGKNNAEDSVLLKKIKDRCYEYSKDYNGFFYHFENSETLIFACGKPYNEENMTTSVLVSREITMPSGVTLKMAVDNIMKKNSGVSAKKYKKSLGKKSRSINGGIYGLVTFSVEPIQFTVEITNSKQKWILKQIQTISHCKGNKEIIRQLEQSGETVNGVKEGKIVVSIIDKKLYETFVKMKNDEVKKQKEQEQKREQEAQKNALDQL